MRKCFYLSNKWTAIKISAYRIFPQACMKCGLVTKRTHVDHIKPRSKFPELELDIMNCQILCKKCNMEKSNTDYTDYRTSDDVLSVIDFISENPSIGKIGTKKKAKPRFKNKRSSKKKEKRIAHAKRMKEQVENKRLKAKKEIVKLTPEQQIEIIKNILT